MAVVVFSPALIGALVYAGTLANGLVYDDQRVVSRAIATGHSWWGLLGSLRGLTFLSVYLDSVVWHGWIPGFHITNIVLHGAASSLAAVGAWFLVRRRSVAWLTAVLFAVHPVHVEAVASVGYRKDLLAMIFVMTAVIFLVSGTRPLLRYGGTVAGFGLALMAKEVAAVGLAFMLPLTSLTRGRTDAGSMFPRPASRQVWAVIVVAMTLTLALAACQGAGRLLAPGDILNLTEGACRSYAQVLTTSIASIPEWMRLLVMPVRLSADYPLPRPDPASAEFRLGLLFLLAAMVSTVWMLRRHPVPAFGMLWILVMYLPCSNIVPLTRFFVAERYLYVPSFGFCLLASLGVISAIAACQRRHHRRWGKAIAILAGLLILGAAIRSAGRTRDWKDEYSLWGSAFHAYPEGTGRICLNYGTALAERGDLEAATRQFQRAVILLPAVPDAHLNLGKVLLTRGEVAAGTAQLRDAIALAPRDPDARFYLGLGLCRRGSLDSAAVQFRSALRLDPMNQSACLYLGATLIDLNQLDEAVDCLGRFVSNHAGLPSGHHLLGTALLRRGSLDSGEVEYQRALAIEPGCVPVLSAYAWHLSTSPDPSRRNGVRALAMAERAAALTNRGDPRVLRSLAAALAETSRFTEAGRAARAAESLARNSGDVRLAAQIEEMYVTFGNGQPYRETAPSLRILDQIHPWP